MGRLLDARQKQRAGDPQPRYAQAQDLCLRYLGATWLIKSCHSRVLRDDGLGPVDFGAGCGKLTVVAMPLASHHTLRRSAMTTQEQNDRLTRLSAGTPSGNLLRPYWQ